MRAAAGGWSVPVGSFQIYGIWRPRTLTLPGLFFPILGAIGALLAQRQLLRFLLIRHATHGNFLRSPRNDIDLLAIALQNPTQLLNLVIEVIQVLLMSRWQRRQVACVGETVAIHLRPSSMR
jgi:hypothetical protein